MAFAAQLGRPAECVHDACTEILDRILFPRKAFNHGIRYTRLIDQGRGDYVAQMFRLRAREMEAQLKAEFSPEHWE